MKFSFFNPFSSSQAKTIPMRSIEDIERIKQEKITQAEKHIKDFTFSTFDRHTVLLRHTIDDKDPRLVAIREADVNLANMREENIDLEAFEANYNAIMHMGDTHNLRPNYLPSAPPTNNNIMDRIQNFFINLFTGGPEEQEDRLFSYFEHPSPSEEEADINNDPTSNIPNNEEEDSSNFSNFEIIPLSDNEEEIHNEATSNITNPSVNAGIVAIYPPQLTLEDLDNNNVISPLHTIGELDHNAVTNPIIYANFSSS